MKFWRQRNLWLIFFTVFLFVELFSLHEIVEILQSVAARSQDKVDFRSAIRSTFVRCVSDHWHRRPSWSSSEFNAAEFFKTKFHCAFMKTFLTPTAEFKFIEKNWPFCLFWQLNFKDLKIDKNVKFYFKNGWNRKKEKKISFKMKQFYTPCINFIKNVGTNEN